MGVRRHRQLHGHARRGTAPARDRGDPPPQGRRQGLRGDLADQGHRQTVFQLRPAPDPLGEGGEVLNDQKPIWVEPKSQVTEEQYTRFYQHLTHHPDETPLWHLHLAADSPIQFRAIVYCPPTNLERLGFTRLEHGLNLWRKRVLVQSECRELVPEYLRFLHGLVDSEDLPLNVSRETLQDNSVIRRIRTSIVKGVLDRLDNLAKDQPDDVQDVLQPVRRDAQRRAGRRRDRLANFQENRERIAKLLRFASSRSEDPSAMVSLDEYIARMPEGQKRSTTWAGRTSPRSPRARTSRSSAAAGSRCSTSPTRSTSSPSPR